MSRLNRLTQWTAGGASLRQLDRAGAGDPPERALQAQVHGYEVGADLEKTVGRRLADFEPDDDPRMPVESLSVYRSEGCWRDREGHWRLTVHGFASEAAYARGECVLGQGSLWQEAAALSYLSLPAGIPNEIGTERKRRIEHDVRPALLVLMHAEDLAALPVCARYGVNYLTIWCATRRRDFSEPAILAAASDALSLIFRTRALPECGRRTGRQNTPSLAQRSRQFGVRNADYAELRALMVGVYRRRLHEAEQRFTACADYVAPKTGTSHGGGFASESWWHPERLPPVNSYTTK